MTTQFQTGAAALAALTATNDTVASKDKTWTKLSTSAKKVVRVMTPTDFATFYNYGSYDRNVNSFVAETPPSLNNAGFPTKETMTPWDKAAQYYQDLANKTTDKTKKQAYKEEARIYRGQLRFINAFIDLDTGEPIYVDLTKKQTRAIHATIASVAEKGKLDKKAFEISKVGDGTATTAVATQLDLDDLTPEQAKNFDAVGADFVGYDYEGLNYVASLDEQVANLRKAGFDPSLIGYGEATAPSIAKTDEEDLPF